MESYSTPVVWRDQLILHRVGVIEAYQDVAFKDLDREVPSPLLYQGRLFLVRNGGIATCLDAGKR